MRNLCLKSPVRPLSSTFTVAPISYAIPLPTVLRLPNLHILLGAAASLFATAFPHKQPSLQPSSMPSLLIYLFFTRPLVPCTSQSPLPTSSSQATLRAPISACLFSSSFYRSTALRHRQPVSTIIQSTFHSQQA